MSRLGIGVYAEFMTGFCFILSSQGLLSLLELDLSHNKINQISDNSFYDLSEVNSLNLMGNEIAFLSGNVNILYLFNNGQQFVRRTSETCTLPLSLLRLRSVCSFVYCQTMSLLD